MHGRGEKYQQSSNPAEIYHSRSIQLIDLGRTEEVALKRKQDIARPAYWDKSLPECGLFEGTGYSRAFSLHACCCGPSASICKALLHGLTMKKRALPGEVGLNRDEFSC